MRKIFLLLSLAIVQLYGHAQITMTLQVQQNGIIQKPQLWNMLFVNTDADAAYVHVSLVLTSTSSNQPVLTATTNMFTLSNGTTLVQSGNVEPIQYEYPSPGFMNEDPNGFLPVGEYEACYTLSRQVNEVLEVVAESCIHLTVEPLSPPMLNAPLDEDVLETRYPQFTWLPPAPLNIFNNLTYDFILVEVQEGQTSTEAIQQNIPVYTEGNLTNIFLNYPSSNAQLDTAKLYAWQIIAKDNNQFAAQSEVWTFNIKADSIFNNIQDTTPYIKLRREPDGSISSCPGILKFAYQNEADDERVSYKIISMEDEDLGTVLKTDSLSLSPGKNLVSLPLLGDDRLIDGKTYYFELLNSRDEVWITKFIYYSPSLQ